MIEIGGACGRHRAALVDFVDRAEIGPSTGAALNHLDRCERCTSELESTVLAITALRRLGEEAAGVEPPADAWPRLRARIDRWRARRWLVMSPTLGTAMSALLVAVIVGPLQFGDSNLAASAASAPEERGRVSIEERRAEAAYIARRGDLPSGESASTTSSFRVIVDASAIPRKYPDNIRPERKEVTPAGPNRYPPEAI